MIARAGAGGLTMIKLEVLVYGQYSLSLRTLSHYSHSVVLTRRLARLSLSGFIYKSIRRLGEQQKNFRAFGDRWHRTLCYSFRSERNPLISLQGFLAAQAYDLFLVYRGVSFIRSSFFHLSLYMVTEPLHMQNF